MNIIDNYKKVVFENYANFSGRATRSEYWYFVLMNIIISIVLSLLEAVSGMNPNSDESILANIYSLLVIVPSIAAGVRRIHDGNRSGWFILIPIYNLILTIQKGTEGVNRFGEDRLQQNNVNSEPQSSSQTEDQASA